MNARLAEIARNLRRRGSPAVVVAPPAIVAIASPEVDPPNEQSDRLPDPVETEVEVGARVEPLAIVPSGAHRAIEIASSGSKEAGEVARVEGEPSKSKSASARIRTRVRRRVPANRASARADGPKSAWPRMRPKKRKTPSNSRNRSLGGSRLEKILRLRAAGSQRWMEKK
ncbi:hypothetical protein Salat_1666900 [Sesamum alatum]|uniref:Uncharacterized protein n=1 Tax=Sesamum alatum TaxID=300844 RepID=A0AAE1Y6R5_9LAMI|nr:hypothetical protein Salat_1666900 [Sesamum alatum]